MRQIDNVLNTLLNVQAQFKKAEHDLLMRGRLSEKPDIRNKLTIITGLLKQASREARAIKDDKLSAILVDAWESFNAFWESVEKGQRSFLLAMHFADRIELAARRASILQCNESDETESSAYVEIDCACRTISIGTNTHAITSAAQWDFFKLLVFDQSLDKITPRYEGTIDRKNQLDAIRRKIGKTTNIVSSLKGGYRLNPNVRIKNNSQVAIRRTKTAKHKTG